MKSGITTDLKEHQLEFAEKHLVNFQFIWLILDLMTEVSSHDVIKNEQLKLFTCLTKKALKVHKSFSMEECIQLLHQYSDQSVFLVISNDAPLDEQSISKLRCFINVEYIYHFGSDDLWRKTKGDASNNIVRFSQDVSCLHILPSDVSSRKLENLDAETQRLVLKFFLIEILHRSPTTSQAKEDFLTYSESKYHSDHVRLEQIRQFKKSYNPDNAILWYTKGDFASRILNKTLRSCDLGPMFKSRYFISNIYSRLEKLYRLQRSTLLCDIVRLYRGKLLLREECDDLCRNIGKHVMANSFVSCFADEPVAFAFSGKDAEKSENHISVVFVIENLHPENVSKPYAYIATADSTKPHEYEVLLSFGTLFKIRSVKIHEDNVWTIHLYRGVEEQKLELELYTHLCLQLGVLNQPSDLVSLVETINDNQYVEQAKAITSSDYPPTTSNSQSTNFSNNTDVAAFPEMIMTIEKVDQLSLKNRVYNQIIQRPRVWKLLMVFMVIFIGSIILISVLLVKALNHGLPNSSTTTTTSTTTTYGGPGISSTATTYTVASSSSPVLYIWVLACYTIIYCLKIAFESFI
ncbi:unnamed protein product [Rotaria socialis]|uniref:Uncharacterized protein n=1 Tax=Rotaria socialis TaxID=392032 RepID=A0A818AZT0_9BILA|nr:unnamed protein product [Rotaria socialis]